MRSSALRALASAVVAALTAACSPALDWRDVRPEGSALLLQFPCRPAHQQRSVPLAGATVPLTLYVCSADGLTWGLAYADAGDAARLVPTMAALVAAAAGNIGATVGAPQPLAVPGAAPQPPAGRWRLAGRGPDGNVVQMQLAAFAQGTQVFQATAHGTQVGNAAADVFFESASFELTRSPAR